MGQDWRVRVWGVRGSAPRPEADYMKFGGNTVCISLEYQEELIVLDAGSGLHALGNRVTADRFKRLHILLGHLHVDHIMGLFSFWPFYNPKAEIHLYGRAGFQKELGLLMGPPFWPQGFGDFSAKLYFHELHPKEVFGVGGLKGDTMEGNHPGGSLLYRLEASGKRLTYALDCEISPDNAYELEDFSCKSSLLIWDATFAPEDMRFGWGHSTWKQGIALGRKAQAERVLMTHYSQEYTDVFLSRQEHLAMETDSISSFAREGMVIQL